MMETKDYYLQEIEILYSEIEYQYSLNRPDKEYIKNCEYKIKEYKDILKERTNV